MSTAWWRSSWMVSRLIPHSTGPNQNRRERRAQLVAKHREKTIFGRAGRLGVFLLALKFVFDPATLDEETDLTAEGLDQFQQIIVWHRRFVTKRLNDTVDGAAGEMWKGEAAAQTCF